MINQTAKTVATHLVNRKKNFKLLKNYKKMEEEKGTNERRKESGRQFFLIQRGNHRG